LRRHNKPVSFPRLILAVILAGATVLSASPQAAQAETGIPADMNKSFTPTFIAAGDISRLKVSIYNSNFYHLVLSTIPAAWSDTLPPGISFANPANAVSTCGGTVSIIGQTLSLIGGSVPAKSG